MQTAIKAGLDGVAAAVSGQADSFRVQDGLPLCEGRHADQQHPFQPRVRGLHHTHNDSFESPRETEAFKYLRTRIDHCFHPICDQADQKARVAKPAPVRPSESIVLMRQRKELENLKKLLEIADNEVAAPSPPRSKSLVRLAHKYRSPAPTNRASVVTGPGANDRSSSVLK